MSDETEVVELSARAVVLGALLSAILSGANAYLGLFAGMTVSASIPAAVISMGLLRVVGGTLLENNQVQTAASAGESAAAGAIFTLPALVLLGAWAEFDLLICAVLVAVGGVLGVLFTILLRRALVVDGDLPFPEGTATAAVLEAGHRASGPTGGLGALALGAVWGATFKFLQSGLAVCAATAEVATVVAKKTFYFGAGVSPALTAVGYIVGFEVALVVFLGGAVNWLMVLPWVAEPEATKPALDVAWTAWSTKTRYLGVGAMTVGGVGALFEVRGTIAQAISGGMSQAVERARQTTTRGRLDRDLSTKIVVWGLGLSTIVLFFVFRSIVQSVVVAAVLAILVLIVGFLFSSVAAYMAGLVGSSNNPVSGVTIATILFTSLLLAAWGVTGSGLDVPQAGPAAAILVGSVICTAAAIGGDNVQDLKAGYLVGATPARQQIMQLVGVLVAALVLGPVLQLLSEAYGFGMPTEEHPAALRAPQATLMASVAQGVFGGTLPWPYLHAGAGLGGAAFALDAFLRRRKSTIRFPVLAFALGLYLPWEMTVPVLLGGLVARARRDNQGGVGGVGVLMAAGLITGEALMGIALAALVVIFGGLEGLRSFGGMESPVVSLAFLGITLALLFKRREPSS